MAILLFLDILLSDHFPGPWRFRSTRWEFFSITRDNRAGRRFVPVCRNSVPRLSPGINRRGTLVRTAWNLKMTRYSHDDDDDQGNRFFSLLHHAANNLRREPMPRATLTGVSRKQERPTAPGTPVWLPKTTRHGEQNGDNPANFRQQPRRTGPGGGLLPVTRKASPGYPPGQIRVEPSRKQCGTANGRDIHTMMMMIKGTAFFLFFIMRWITGCRFFRHGLE